MKKLEKDMMCVLLQRLLKKELITQEIHDQARSKVLDLSDGSDFYCYFAEEGKERGCGHTQNSC